MQLIQAIILGIIQGLTEFIPVSSSGHLILAGHWLGFSGGLAFDIALNIGTLAALAVFFRKDFVDLAVALVKRTEHSRLAWILALATVPAVVAGVELQNLAETTFRSDNLVAINLIIVAIVMLIVDRWSQNKDLSAMSPQKGLAIGLAQAVALVPGVSRSGITISTGRALGFDRVSATRFSFLLSAPIIAGATAKVMLKSANIHVITAEPAIFAVGIIASFVSGYWAIRFLLRYLANHGLSLFAYYRIAIGVLVLLVSAGK